MSFLKKIFKPVSKIVSHIPGGDIIVPAALTAAGMPYAAAAFSGANTLGNGGSPLNAIGSAAGSYIGGQIGSNYFPGTVGGTASNILGGGTANSLFNGIGNTLGNGVASGLFNASIGGALGSNLGSALGSTLGGVKSPSNTGMDTSTNSFSPTRQAEASAPSSLGGDFQGLNPEQKTSNLASRGVYGGGLGPQEQSYFLNLVNRQLVDNSGQTQDMNTLQPIEQSYLQQLGLGGKNNTSDLLQAISGYKFA